MWFSHDLGSLNRYLSGTWLVNKTGCETMAFKKEYRGQNISIEKTVPQQVSCVEEEAIPARFQSDYQDRVRDFGNTL